jgi:predicted RecB family nuclease
MTVEGPRKGKLTLDDLIHTMQETWITRVRDGQLYAFHSAASVKGFARLPRPDPGDIFFDMEGYPSFDDGSSLEYLFGFVTADGETPQFTPLWAHDRQAEKRAFEDAIDFITARLEKHPNDLTATGCGCRVASDGLGMRF